MGVGWQQSYNQTTLEQGYKWSYQAYQAYQPGSAGGELDHAFAVNNDVILYEVDMSREDLPQPPQALGNIQSISWKVYAQLHRVGDKSAVWKTTLGDLLTPVWWLEFYQGHAYVRISLLGFPTRLPQPSSMGWRISLQPACRPLWRTCAPMLPPSLLPTPLSSCSIGHARDPDPTQSTITPTQSHEQPIGVCSCR